MPVHAGLLWGVLNACFGTANILSETVWVEPIANRNPADNDTIPSLTHSIGDAALLFYDKALPKGRHAGDAPLSRHG